MSKADELAKLDALRRTGVLTRDEFDAEKARILSEDAPYTVYGPQQGAPDSAGSSPGRPIAGDTRNSPADQLEVPGSGAPTSETTGSAVPTIHPSTAAPAALTNRRPRGANLALVAIAVIVVAAVGIGAFVLFQSTSSRSQAEQTQNNIITAVTGGDAYYVNSNQTFAGILQGSPGLSSIGQVDSSLRFVAGSAASGGPGVISVREIGGEILVLTAWAPDPGFCYGLLDVKSDKSLPPGLGVGLNYFQMRQPTFGGCKASVGWSQMSPLWTGGWPSGVKTPPGL